MLMKNYIAMISIFIIIVCAAGCSSGASGGYESIRVDMEETVISTNESGTDNEEEVVYEIMEILECSEETAKSFCSKLERAISSSIVKIEIDTNDDYRVLKLTSSSGDTFFAKVMSGYFLSEVRKNSLDGSLIYKAIQ